MTDRPDEWMIVDRDPESKVLERLLTFETMHRILIVSDGDGRGKTDLLRKLRWQCESQFDRPVPVALFNFEDERVSHFDVVVELARQLSTGSEPVEFPRFDELAAALDAPDQRAFAEAVARALKGTVHINASNAQLEDEAKVIGAQVNIASVSFGARPWDDKAAKLAQSRCIEAFLADLGAAGHDRPIVVLIDTVNAADSELRRWLVRQLLVEKLLTEWQDHQVLFVLAGRDIDSLVQGLNESQRQRLESAPRLSGWTKDEVQAFLAVHGYPNLSEQGVATMVTAIEQGTSLHIVKQLAEVYARGAGP
jgi:hypothetical protein